MAWTSEDRKKWFSEQIIQRSYESDVLTRIRALMNRFDVVSYGRLSVNPERYPLFFLRSQKFESRHPTVLITGGVHGYETSGMQGALAFMEERAAGYESKFNFYCFPCISPWGYETINRWNDQAVDPNRSFYANSPSEECSFFLKALTENKISPIAHFDLHETTDTDATQFRPLLAARDGVSLPHEDIPDGFYLVGLTHNPAPEFQRAIIERVKKVTHIAPADREGKIIGEKMGQEGVINYPKLKLCAHATEAPYVTITEVYPDSPRTTPENCVMAQTEAICAGLDYLKDRHP